MVGMSANESILPQPTTHSVLPISVVALVLANAGVLYLYFAYDITAFQLVLVFWCECLWIGVFSAIKLVTASLFGNPFENRWANVSRGAALFLSVIVIGLSATAFFSLLGAVLMSILFANETLVLSSVDDEVINHVGLVFGASLLLLGGHAVSFVGNFLVLGEFKCARVGTLVALPFRRSSALFIVILACFCITAMLPGLATTGAFAAMVIALKTAWDLRLHVLERAEFGTGREASQS